MKSMRPSPLLSLLALIVIFPLIAAPSTGSREAYATAKCVLELDGTVAGWLSSVEGGNPYGEVVNEKVGTDRIQRKRVAGVRHEDLTITFGAGMSTGFYDWIKDTLDGKGPRKNGAVVMTDNSGQVLNRLVFYDALIKEVIFSPFDAVSKEPGQITLKLSCGYTQRTYAGGTIDMRAVSNKQKKWLQCHFQLKMDGLDDIASRAGRIESITVTQRLAQATGGNAKMGLGESTVVEVSNITVTFPDDYAEPLRSWLDDFVIKGNRGLEKGGAIEVLTPNSQNVIFTLVLSNLGILKLSPDYDAKDKSGIRKVKADMYCEDVDFIYLEDANPAESSRRSG